jgi:hypothetical protein
MVGSPLKLNTSTGDDAWCDVDDADGADVDVVDGVVDFVITGVVRLDNVPNCLI